MRAFIAPKSVGEISGKRWEQAFALLPRGEFVDRLLGGYVSPTHPSTVFVYLTSYSYLIFSDNEFTRDLDIQSADKPRRIRIEYEARGLKYCGRYLKERELAKI